MSAFEILLPLALILCLTKLLGLGAHRIGMPAVIGMLIAGLLIEALAELCIALWTIESLDYVLWGLFALAAVLFIVTIVKLALTKPKTDVKHPSDTDGKPVSDAENRNKTDD